MPTLPVGFPNTFEEELAEAPEPTALAPMMAMSTNSSVDLWSNNLYSGNPTQIANVAREFAEAAARVDPNFIFTIYDKLWNPIGSLGGWIIDGSGTDPRNKANSAKLTFTADCPHIHAMSQCRQTMVGITVETNGLRWAFYVDTFERVYEDGEWRYVANLVGIYDILNWMVIWPDWFLPIQAQIFSHAVYFWALVTVIENMVSECALRIQGGIWEPFNNALSLNPDIRTWFGTLLQSNGNIATMLKTPVYVVRTNPLLDTSPLVARTVRMETVGAVIEDITKAYGVDVRVDLWLPGDEQPDQWANLDQPTYVVTVKDRSQVTGPTQTVLDAVVRQVVDLGGAFFGDLGGLIRQVPSMSGVFESPILGVHFHEPWAVLIAPDKGEDGNITSCKIVDHTPKGWQHIIGGRSPKWLNDLFNATFAWLIDSLMIILGFTGVPSDLLSGFMNNAFLAFQLMQLYDRRNEMGPYHPAIEVFHATASAPYNIETIFAFINAFWDSRGWTSAQVTIRNGEVYTLGKDIFRGSLMSIVYDDRTKMLTDYIENIMWRISVTERDVFIQIGDGQAEEAPLAKHQRNLTSAFEIVNVLTLAPQS